MTILYIIIAILAIPFIIAIFGADEFTIERKTTVKKSKADIYNYLKFLKNSEQYNKWVMADPNMKRDFKGTDGTVGFVYSWESTMKQVGQGDQEILNLQENERIEYEIRFIKPFPGTSSSHLALKSITDGETEITWAFKGTKNYMMKVMHVVLNLEKVLAKDLQVSLANLKAIVEK